MRLERGRSVETNRITGGLAAQVVLNLRPIASVAKRRLISQACCHVHPQELDSDTWPYAPPHQDPKIG